MNILITGGTGFIGKNLVENLKEKYKVRYCIVDSTKEIKEVSENIWEVAKKIL